MTHSYRRTMHCFLLNRIVAVVIICAISATWMAIAIAQDQRGKRLYHHGHGATASLMQGKITVPASQFPCASCHGADGMGRREGGTLIPPINWGSLSERTTNRPAYSVQSFRKAVVNGEGAHGGALGEVMPRYDISQDLIISLVDFLQQLDVEQRSGVVSDSISIKPPREDETRLGFTSAIERFNQDGGSFGRLIMLTEEEPSFVQADSIIEYIEDELDTAVLKYLIRVLREDGHGTVASFSDKPDQAVAFELEKAGIQLAATAKTVFMMNRSIPSPAAVDAWLRQSMEADLESASDSESTHVIYAAASAMAPYLVDFVDGDHELVLIDHDEQSVRWALSQKLSARAAAGFAAGTLLGEAILQSGRSPTRTAVMRSLGSLALQDRMFVWRTEANQSVVQ